MAAEAEVAPTKRRGKAIKWKSYTPEEEEEDEGLYNFVDPNNPAWLKRFCSEHNLAKGNVSAGVINFCCRVPNCNYQMRAKLDEVTGKYDLEVHLFLT